VLFTNRDPPLEIRQVPGLKDSEDIGYVTFVLFPRHFTNPNVAAGTISHIELFRDYLHYHIKCSKAYMQSRMRHRVSEFQKVLNRAKTEAASLERKTVTYVPPFFVRLIVVLKSLFSVGGPCKHGECNSNQGSVCINAIIGHPTPTREEAFWQ
jgi:hypothetical protein